MKQLNDLTWQDLIPFCLQEYLGRTYFPKEYLFTRKNNSQEYLFPGNYDWGVDISRLISTGDFIFMRVYISGDTRSSY